MEGWDEVWLAGWLAGWCIGSLLIGIVRPRYIRTASVPLMQGAAVARGTDSWEFEQKNQECHGAVSV